MPKRDPDLLVGDIRACLRQVAEYIRGLERFQQSCGHLSFRRRGRRRYI